MFFESETNFEILDLLLYEEKGSTIQIDSLVIDLDNQISIIYLP